MKRNYIEIADEKIHCKKNDSFIKYRAHEKVVFLYLKEWKSSLDNVYDYDWSRDLYDPSHLYIKKGGAVCTPEVW